MPPSIAHIILLIFTTNWNDNKPNGPALYDDDDFLEHLGIVRPSSDPKSPLPDGLSREKSKLIAEHIDAAIGVPDGERLRYIEGKPGQTTNTEGAKAWKEYYRRTLGNYINNRLDNFLRVEGIHPYILIQDNLTDEWPSITAMERTVEIGHELCGPSVMKGEKQLHRRIEPHVRVIISAAYSRIKKNGDRAKDRLKKVWPELEPLLNKGDDPDGYDMDNYTQVFAVINRRRSTMQDIHLFPSTYRVFSKWNSTMRGLLAAKDFDIPDERMHTAAYTAEDDAANKAKGAKLLSKLRYKGKKCDVADPATVAAAFETLAIYLSEPVNADPLDSLDDLVDLPEDEDLADFILQRDMGVDKVRGHSEENLNVLLGRDGDRDQLFNNYTCRETNVHPWDGPYKDHEMFETGVSPDPKIKLSRFVFKWHQGVGLLAILFLLFRKKDEKSQRVLLADDVGLGKTLQALMVIAFIIKVYRCDVAGKRRPPAVDDDAHRYFDGLEELPNLPHLIVVPNSLEAQWISEIHTYLKNGTCDIFPLPTNPQHVELFFTNPIGEWAKSKRPMIERIVIITQSTLTNLTGKHFNTARRMPSTPPEAPRDVLSHSKVKTFLGMKWFLTVFDEAHESRVPTSKGFQGTMELTRRSKASLMLSATPLHTGARDAHTFGRLLLVDELSGPEGRILELEANAAIRRARVADLRAEAQFQADNEQRVKSGLLPLEKPTGLSEQGKAKFEYIKTIQRHIGDRIIRRTIDSATNDGKNISALANKEMHNYYIRQSDSEHARYLDAVENGLGGVNSADTDADEGSTVEANRNFYINARKAIAAPFIPGESDFPVFKTEADFDNYDGCKLQHLVKLVKHIMVDDRVELPKPTRDGTMIYPELPAVEDGEERPQTNNILIYSLFSLTIKSIVTALQVKGVNPYALHGGLTVKNRNEIVEAWKANTDPARCVLIFTSVGATGCNLEKACFVIHYDQNWSSITDTQIDGRAWRMGQTETVRIIHLIVSRTTDVLMNKMANEKSALLSAAVQRQTLQLLQSVTKTADAEDPEVDPEALGLVTAGPRKAITTPKKRSKSKGKAAEKGKGKGKEKEKEKAVEEDEEEDEEEREKREQQEKEAKLEKEAARKEKRRVADKARRERQKQEKLDKQQQEAAAQGESSAAATKKKGKAKEKAKPKTPEDVESEEEQAPPPAKKPTSGLVEKGGASGAPTETRGSDAPMDVDNETGPSTSQGPEKPAGVEKDGERDAEQPPRASEKPTSAEEPEQRATSPNVTTSAGSGMDVEQQVQPTSVTETEVGITAAPTRASQTPAIAEQQGPQLATSSSEIAPAGAPMDVDTVFNAQAPVDTSMVVDAPPAASASSSTQDAPQSLTEEKEVSSILQAEKTSASPSQESQDPPTQVPDDDDDDEEEEEASDDPTLSKSLHNRVPTSPLSDLPRGYSFDLGGYGDNGETPNDLLLPSTPPPTASGSSAVPDPDDEPQGHGKKRTADRLSPSVSPTEKPKRRKRRNRGMPKPQNAAPYVNANLNKRLATIGDNFISGMSQETHGTRGRRTQPSTPSNRNNSRASSSRRPPQPPGPSNRNDPGAGPSRRPQPPGPTDRNDPGAGPSRRPPQPADPTDRNDPGAGPSRRSTRHKTPHTPR